MSRKCSLAALFALFLTVSSAQDLLERKVDLILEETSLEKALYLLIDDYSLPLSFSNDILPSKLLTATMKDRPLEAVLDYLLRDTNLSFRQSNRQIVIYRTNYRAPAIEPEEHYIRGYIEDKETGEPLIGATVFDRRSGRGTQTNEFGYFAVSLPAGEVEVQFSYLGYVPKTLSRQLAGQEQVRIELSTQLVLDEIVVVASDEDGPFRSEYASEKINISDIEDLPRLAGESDVTRVLSLYPGVQTGTDGLGGIFVRGGDAGHNLILLDGVPVYNLSHGAGMYSIFNTDVIKNVEFTKGVFSARHGGRLASVLDVRTRDGNNREFQGEAGIGLLAGRLSLEGPIVKGKSSFLFSARRSLINWYLRPVTRSLKAKNGEMGSTDYGFYDLNAKINYTLSDRDKFFVSVYSGNDLFLNHGSANNQFHLTDEQNGEAFNVNYDYHYRETFQWGNQVAAFRWNHLFGPRLFSNITLTYSRMEVNVTHSSRDSLLQSDPNRLLGKALNYGRYLSSIEDLGVRADFELFNARGHHIRFGGSILYHSFKPGVIQYDEETEELVMDPERSVSAPRNMEYALYFEDDISIHEKLLLNIGMRTALWAGKDKNYGAAEPRFSLRWAVAPRTNLRFSGGANTQFLHLLSSANFGLPTDLWVPSTAEIRPQRSRQLSLGVNRSLGKQFHFDLDVYYKHMDNLATYEEGAYFLNNWEQSVTYGDGRAYGVEVMLRKKKGKTTGWIAYSLSKTDRRFEAINQGRPYPFKYDRRHDLKMVVRHAFSERFNISSDWVFGTGLAFSFPQYSYDLPYPDLPVDQRDVLVYNGKNNYRMPYYHRLDLAANLRIPGNQVEQLISVGVYNLYNRQNPAFYDIQTRIISDGNRLFKTNVPNQVNFVPILPYLNYSVKF